MSLAINSIKVLGPGCENCHALTAATEAALKELDMDIEVTYITNLQEIMSYGFMRLPVLLVNGSPLCVGKAIDKDEVIALFKQYGYC